MGKNIKPDAAAVITAVTYKPKLLMNPLVPLDKIFEEISDFPNGLVSFPVRDNTEPLLFRRGEAITVCIYEFRDGFYIHFMGKKSLLDDSGDPYTDDKFPMYQFRNSDEMTSGRAVDLVREQLALFCKEIKVTT